MARRPTVPVGEIVVTGRGRPFVNGGAPKARSLSSAFLLEGQEHFEQKGKGIWDEMYEKYPVEYFWGLITLAKVLKIEAGPPGAFDKPRTREEAMDRLERQAGPKVREMLEKFLAKVGEAEQKFIEVES